MLRKQINEYVSDIDYRKIIQTFIDQYLFYFFPFWFFFLKLNVNLVFTHLMLFCNWLKLWNDFFNYYFKINWWKDTANFFFIKILINIEDLNYENNYVKKPKIIK